MFKDSKFDGDINNWNISNVKNTYKFLDGSPLENHPPKWYKD